MSLFDLLNFIGGLALFLFGMETMGQGLRKLSGGRFEATLGRLTASKWRGFLLGAGMTAIIQSSSATTVMVVGFVNSGILQLGQVVTVIMGANVGTTFTSWLLSLTGLQGEHWFVRLLQPTAFTPVLALIGIIFLLMPKARESKRVTGTVLIGFAVLMFGMTLMSQSMKPLADSPRLIEAFQWFTHPLLGLLVGALVTAVIQSSSASVGILQALAAAGVIQYSAVLPIIMGQNIGTCVTALLSGIGSSKNARRASMIHLLFNVIGTVGFMALFYLIHFLHPFTFMAQPASLFGIALIHTAFNLIASFVLLPFSSTLLALSKRLVPVTDQERATEGRLQADGDWLKRLDRRFLADPSFALSQAHDVLKHMATLSEQAFEIALRLIHTFDEAQFEQVKRLEAQVDQYQDRVGTYLLDIAKANLTDRNTNRLNLLMQSMSDLERISDHALNLAFLAQSKSAAEYRFSDQAWQELRLYFQAAHQIVKQSLEVFKSLNPITALEIEPLEQVIDHLNKELHRRHVSRLQVGACSIGKGLIYLDMLSDVERIADHCSNLAVDILSIEDNAFDTHEHIHQLRHQQAFEASYQAFLAQYELPAPSVPEEQLSETERAELKVLTSTLAREKGKTDPA